MCRLVVVFKLPILCLLVTLSMQSTVTMRFCRTVGGLYISPSCYTLGAPKTHWNTAVRQCLVNGRQGRRQVLHAHQLNLLHGHFKPRGRLWIGLHRMPPISLGTNFYMLPSDNGTRRVGPLPDQKDPVHHLPTWQGTGVKVPDNINWHCGIMFDGADIDDYTCNIALGSLCEWLDVDARMRFQTIDGCHSWKLAANGTTLTLHPSDSSRLQCARACRRELGAICVVFMHGVDYCVATYMHLAHVVDVMCSGDATISNVVAYRVIYG